MKVSVQLLSILAGLAFFALTLPVTAAVAWLADPSVRWFVAGGEALAALLVGLSSVRHGVSLALNPRDVEVQHYEREEFRDVKTGQRLERTKEAGKAVHQVDRTGGLLFVALGIFVFYLPAVAVGLLAGSGMVLAFVVAGVSFVGVVVVQVIRARTRQTASSGES